MSSIPFIDKHVLLCLSFRYLVRADDEDSHLIRDVVGVDMTWRRNAIVLITVDVHYVQGV